MTAAAAADPRLEALVDDAVVWASQHGLVVGLGGVPACALVHAPLSVLPVAFPEDRFNLAVSCMPLFSTLIDKVARDEEYLQQTLEQAAGFDEFTRRLLRLLRDSRAARRRLAGREVVLGVHRSDYMLDAPSGGFLQVELNTIASSFACLSTITSRLHAHILGRAAAAAAAAELAARLPPNDAMARISAAMAAAAGAAGGGDVIMVVQPGERNAYDQQWLQQTLWEAHGIRTVRLTLAQIAERCSVDGDTGELKIGGGGSGSGQRVGLVYFRFAVSLLTHNISKCPPPSA
ncbi:glutathione synthase [Monoraphidium neglectum]|uniref:Glutathione synthase n=1 Tax=Monoraphidium neglectum TaxID=145388 RepID=A0A0D2J4C3_9CHLO|nr:glutathione synthase [Monoraphidium neglectum]KIY94777.1 glutathione synthase [Monoraphidium neglectum]|eukprot:XP_013893797.1 glutathione synthase [Monoraphidium neglectum]